MYYICSHCPVAVPLYQEYWMKCMKAELQKAQHKKLAGIVEAQCRSALPSPAASSPPGLHVAPYALWQQLPEVKRQNLLHTLTARDIRHQEVRFLLQSSVCSYHQMYHGCFCFLLRPCLNWLCQRLHIRRVCEWRLDSFYPLLSWSKL